MSAFKRIEMEFGANWTTALVGWKGLGAVSPWPEKWTEFPSLISVDELREYAMDRLADNTRSVEEERLVVRLTSIREETREEVCGLLEELRAGDHGVPEWELRKWRYIALRDAMATMPADPLEAHLTLSEIWVMYGTPDDIPLRRVEMDRSRLVKVYEDWLAQEGEVLRTTVPPENFTN